MTNAHIPGHLKAILENGSDDQVKGALESYFKKTPELLHLKQGAREAIAEVFLNHGLTEMATQIRNGINAVTEESEISVENQALRITMENYISLMRGSVKRKEDGIKYNLDQLEAIFIEIQNGSITLEEATKKMESPRSMISLNIAHARGFLENFRMALSTKIETFRGKIDVTDYEAVLLKLDQNKAKLDLLSEEYEAHLEHLRQIKAPAESKGKSASAA